MRKDDFKKTASTRSKPPSPLWARSCCGTKVIIIADASDRQISEILNALCWPEENGIPQ